MRKLFLFILIIVCLTPSVSIADMATPEEKNREAKIDQMANKAGIPKTVSINNAEKLLRGDLPEGIVLKKEIRTKYEFSLDKIIRKVSKTFITRGFLNNNGKWEEKTEEEKK